MNVYKIDATLENGKDGGYTLRAQTEAEAVEHFRKWHSSDTLNKVTLICEYIPASEANGRKVCSSNIGFCIGDPYHVICEYPARVGISAWDILGRMPGNLNPICKDGPTGLLVVSTETFFKQDDLGFLYDRIYRDQNGRRYTSENDCFSLVPLELLLEDWMPELQETGCQFFYGAGQASMEEHDGVITVELPTGETVVIDTKEYKDDEDD